MKRIILSAILILAAIGCKDDEEKMDPPFVTDGISLDQEKSALLIHSYNPLVGYASQIPSLMLEDAYEGEFNSLYTIADPNHPLYSSLTDSIALNQPLEPAIAFYLNEKTVQPNEIFTEAELALRRNPVATVNHVVSQNDTAWFVDSKIKFFRDTANPRFFIATYLTANIQAAVHTNGVDLRVSNQANFVITADTASVWDMEVFSLDSAKTLTAKGDPFYHVNVLAQNFNKDHAWGTSLSEYTPFGQSFSENDIIGTESTPIQHYFLKPNLGYSDAYEPGMPYTPGFLTVIWVFNVETGRYDYINSVHSTLE